MPTGTDPGERARVVDQGHARELGDGAAEQCPAAVEEPGDGRQLAPSGEVEQVVAVGAVPEQADDVPGPLLVEELGQGTPVGVPRRPSGRRRARRGSGRRRRRGPRVGTMPLSATPRAGQHQRGPGLTRVEAAVLTEVPAALRPVVGSGVDDVEVGAAVRVGEGRHSRRAANG